MKACGGKSCLLGNKSLKGYAEMLVPCFPWCPADIMRPVKISENAVSQASGTALLKGGIPDWAAHPSPTQVPSILATAYDRPSGSRQVGSLHPEQLPSPSSLPPVSYLRNRISFKHHLPRGAFPADPQASYARLCAPSCSVHRHQPASGLLSITPTKLCSFVEKTSLYPPNLAQLKLCIYFWTGEGYFSGRFEAKNTGMN